MFGCDLNCTADDPYTFPVRFTNLTLTPVRTHSSPDGEFGQLSDTTAGTMSSSYDQSAVYYVTVEALTASGYRFQATSNGVIVDVTPPVLVSPIKHFDVSFSLTEATRFQGNNSTIAASWSYRDLQSGIVEYLWAIGTQPNSDDIQQFESVAMATSAINDGLLGVLQDNSTYYVTVRAVNGAGLSSTVSSGGVTYTATELNVTELQTFVALDFVDVLLNVGTGGVQEDIVRLETENMVSVSWFGVGEDVEDICKFTHVAIVRGKPI